MAEVLDDVYAFDGIYPAGNPKDDVAAYLVEIAKHYMDGHSFAKRLHLEDAVRSFNLALNESRNLALLDPALCTYHSCRILGCLGNAMRRLGRYEEGITVLKTALDKVRFRPTQAHLRSELAIIYQQQTRFDDAHDEADLAYDIACDAGLKMAACRLQGVRGYIWYIEYSTDKDRVKLDKAVKFLKAGASQALKLAEEIEMADCAGPNKRLKYDLIGTYRSFALSRLSRCYTVLGDHDKALETARQAWEGASRAGSASSIAYTEYFYGRALLNLGHDEEAQAHLDPAEGLTPVMTFSSEPTDHYNEYLRDLIGLGVDLQRPDDNGYTPLERAFFSGHQSTIDIIKAGLRERLRGKENAESQLKTYVAEARIRKAYREIFQDRLRPVLLTRRASNLASPDLRAMDMDGPRISDPPKPSLDKIVLPDGLKILRREYFNVLEHSEEKRQLFDPLLLVSYQAFLQQGELRRSNPDCEVQPYQPVSEATEYVIFLSYARLRKGTVREDSPDDVNNTIFKRMVAAIEEFLRSHKDIERETLKIWVDHASVAPLNPQPGINALPIIVAQCDAVISLVDDIYYSRAWCSVEVLMAQTLAKAYGLLEWWEQVPNKDMGSKAGLVNGGGHSGGAGRKEKEDGRGAWMLRKSDLNMKIELQGKNLSYEEDRPRVLFLERQSRLLG